MSYKVVKDFIVKILKAEAIKFVLVKLIGTVAGFKAWVIKLITEYLFDQVAVPIIEYSIRKAYLYYDIQKGRIVYGKVLKAKDDKDKDEYRKNIGNV